MAVQPPAYTQGAGTPDPAGSKGSDEKPGEDTGLRGWQEGHWRLLEPHSAPEAGVPPFRSPRGPAFSRGTELFPDLYQL